jgi:hypothetical protein
MTLVLVAGWCIANAIHLSIEHQSGLRRYFQVVVAGLQHLKRRRPTSS